jgi:fumarylpyruvate hydrolase
MSAEPLFAWDTPSLPIDGDERRFPVRRIFCVGRNYAAHAREMGHDPDRAPPFFFMKPADALVPGGGEVPYPTATEDLHHEVELAVALGAPLDRADPEAALRAVWGYAVAVDLTRRDRQAEAKAQGRPWEVGKAFDASCPCGPVVPASRFDPARGRIWLSVDGAVRQDGDLAQLIWPVPELLSRASALFALKPGDLVLTGTPAGVGALVPGNAVEAGIAGLGILSLRIGAPAGA